MRDYAFVDHRLYTREETIVEGSTNCLDALICSGARRLTGYQRRLFMAEVATELCEGSARQAERRFGGDEKQFSRDCTRLVKGCAVSRISSPELGCVVKRRIRN